MRTQPGHICIQGSPISSSVPQLPFYPTLSTTRFCLFPLGKTTISFDNRIWTLIMLQKDQGKQWYEQELQIGEIDPEILVKSLDVLFKNSTRGYKVDVCVGSQ